jgi:hypothetical protein
METYRLPRRIRGLATMRLVTEDWPHSMVKLGMDGAACARVAYRPENQHPIQTGHDRAERTAVENARDYGRAPSTVGARSCWSQPPQTCGTSARCAVNSRCDGRD